MGTNMDMRLYSLPCGDSFEQFIVLIFLELKTKE